MLPASGATTVTVSTAATQGNNEVIFNAAVEELNAQFSVSNPTALASYLLFFLPPGTLSGAYAWVGGKSSVYQSGWYVHAPIL
jgi:hypothetical protein